MDRRHLAARHARRVGDEQLHRLDLRMGGAERGELVG
jgi:hypothetical protein